MVLQGPDGDSRGGAGPDLDPALATQQYLGSELAKTAASLHAEHAHSRLTCLPGQGADTGSSDGTGTEKPDWCSLPKHLTETEALHAHRHL